jgi:hypothetical protein
MINDFVAEWLIYRVEDQIREQNCYAGYSRDAIIEGMRACWLEDHENFPTSHPDEYWRELQGRSGDFARLTQVALRFITLKCSEADMEHLLSL